MIKTTNLDRCKSTRTLKKISAAPSVRAPEISKNQAIRLWVKNLSRIKQGNDARQKLKSLEPSLCPLYVKGFVQFLKDEKALPKASINQAVHFIVEDSELSHLFEHLPQTPAKTPDYAYYASPDYIVDQFNNKGIASRVISEDTRHVSLESMQNPKHPLPSTIIRSDMAFFTYMFRYTDPALLLDLNQITDRSTVFWYPKDFGSHYLSDLPIPQGAGGKTAVLKTKTNTFWMRCQNKLKKNRSYSDMDAINEKISEMKFRHEHPELDLPSKAFLQAFLKKSDQFEQFEKALSSNFPHRPISKCPNVIQMIDNQIMEVKEMKAADVASLVKTQLNIEIEAFGFDGDVEINDFIKAQVLKGLSKLKTLDTVNKARGYLTRPYKQATYQGQYQRHNEMLSFLNLGDGLGQQLSFYTTEATDACKNRAAFVLGKTGYKLPQFFYTANTTSSTLDRLSDDDISHIRQVFEETRTCGRDVSCWFSILTEKLTDYLGNRENNPISNTGIKGIAKQLFFSLIKEAGIHDIHHRLDAMHAHASNEEKEAIFEAIHYQLSVVGNYHDYDEVDNNTQLLKLATCIFTEDFSKSMQHSYTFYFNLMLRHFGEPEIRSALEPIFDSLVGSCEKKYEQAKFVLENKQLNFGNINTAPSVLAKNIANAIYRKRENDEQTLIPFDWMKTQGIEINKSSPKPLILFYLKDLVSKDAAQAKTALETFITHDYEGYDGHYHTGFAEIIEMMGTDSLKIAELIFSIEPSEKIAHHLIKSIGNVTDKDKIKVIQDLFKNPKLQAELKRHLEVIEVQGIDQNFKYNMYKSHAVKNFVDVLPKEAIPENILKLNCHYQFENLKLSRFSFSINELSKAVFELALAQNDPMWVLEHLQLFTRDLLPSETQFSALISHPNPLVKSYTEQALIERKFGKTEIPDADYENYLDLYLKNVGKEGEFNKGLEEAILQFAINKLPDTSQENDYIALVDDVAKALIRKGSFVSVAALILAYAKLIPLDYRAASRRYTQNHEQQQLTTRLNTVICTGLGNRFFHMAGQRDNVAAEIKIYQTMFKKIDEKPARKLIESFLKKAVSSSKRARQ